MELIGTQKIAAPPDKVWAALFDPEVLKQSIPGCESIEATGENELTAKVTLRIGPVKASFSGRVTLTDLVPPQSCTLSGEGQGGVAGFAKGSANVHLAQDGPGATLLSYEAKADVGGKLAQLGGRLIDATARKLAGEFFESFGNIVAPQAVNTDASVSAEAQGAQTSEAAAKSETQLAATEPQAKKSWLSWLAGLFRKSSATILVITAGLLAPPCCLDGSHVHPFGQDFLAQDSFNQNSFGLDSFGPICKSR